MDNSFEEYSTIRLLKDVREKLSMSQDDMAILLNMPCTSLTEIEDIENTNYNEDKIDDITLLPNDIVYKLYFLFDRLSVVRNRSFSEIKEVSKEGLSRINKEINNRTEKESKKIFFLK